MKSKQPKIAAPENLGEQSQTSNGVFPVVAIGASAGGLEAFTALLGSLAPDTGMAFVFVQHLQPTHRSVLADILSKSTRIPVSEVNPGVKVLPNHIYVIPPNVNMTIAEGTLQLTKRGDEAGQHLPIDLFMRSLAEERKSRAIGIILSGTASDGTLGMAAIKAEGGITFAQDPKSAKYDGMPHSAIASGCVDFVLSPDEIAHELSRISRHPYVNQVKEEKDVAPSSASGGEFSQIFGLLKKLSGVDFAQYKINTIQRRTLRRMVLHKIDGVRDYVGHLQSNPEELENLYQDLLIPVTNFFRDSGVFACLKAKVFPAIVKGKANKGTIRIWSPACSTGEETYSLAIALLEFLGDKASSFQVQLFGTDVNDKGIAKARAGVYPESISQDVSPERLRRFFVKTEGGYRVSKTIRELCVFARQNLAGDPPFSQMNLVACRNLLIYMGPALQKKVIPILHYALQPSGFLVLGSSESVSAFPNLFSTVDKKHKIYSKKAVASRLHYDSSTTHYPVESGAPSTITPVPQHASQAGFDAQAEADRAVLKEHSPVGVVINGALEVVQFRGRTTPYLEQAPGRPSVNLLKMARGGLAFELRSALNAVKKKGATIRKREVPFDSDGQKKIINFSVSPLGGSGPSPEERYFLILFEDVTSYRVSDSADGGAGGRKSAAALPHREIARLKQELASTQESLRAAIESEEATKEEFQSANEEVLSANEELQSTNEELETSKEELQSANEELNTLNDELRERNVELSRLNSDLDNLLTSVRIPVAMLDFNLRIRRLTPAADKLLKVMPSDIGRPISDIRLNIRVSNLEQMISSVMDTLHSTEHEVQDLEYRWHSLQIHPYKTADNRIDGVVLALFDIDAIKKSNEQLRKSSEFFRSIINTVREPLLVLDSDLRIVAANESFLRTFRVSSEDAVHKFLYRVSEEGWNIPKLRILLEDLLPNRREIANFELEAEFPGIGTRSMLLNACPLIQVTDGDPLILLAMEDITERKLANTALIKSEKMAVAGRVAGVLAHEINNPLQAVSNLMGLLANHPGLDAQATEYSSMAKQELARVVHLVRQALGFYRESSAPESVHVKDVLDSICNLYAKQFEQKRIRITKQFDNPTTIQSYPGQIRQVLSTLLTNAIEAIGEDGTITLRASVSPDWRNPSRRGVRLSVADSGPGIPPERRSRIFEPFFTTKGERGVGLGLWVTQNIVQRMGGSIHVKSRHHKEHSGTCFSIFLPDEIAASVPVKKAKEQKISI